MTIIPTAPSTAAPSAGALASPGSDHAEVARRRHPGVILALVLLVVVLAVATFVAGRSGESALAPDNPAAATDRGLASLDAPVTPVSADGYERWLASREPAGPTSADAAERRGATGHHAVPTRCIGSSADALERCVTSG
jgi:hypothetical protein